jgi:hypothetical protein
MSASDLTKTVFALLQKRLVLLGFRKRKQGILSMSVTEDVLGLIGLNKATGGRGPGVLEINPVVGVRNQIVERLVAELVGEPFDELNPFTAGANVGYLSPQSKYQPSIFAETAPLDGPADQLIDAIRAYGLPFIHSNSSLPTLLETMRSNRFAIQHVAAFRIPAALHVLGRHAEANAFLTDEVAKLGARTDQAAKRFRVFADHFKERNRAPTSN